MPKSSLMAIGLSPARFSRVLMCPDAREALNTLGSPLYSRQVTERKLRPIVNLPWGRAEKPPPEVCADVCSV